MSELKLGALVTHPVQYHSPLFRELAKRCELTVYYAHRPTAEEQGAGFGVAFQWDVDLTSGYEHVWLENVAERPSVTNYSGCDTPEIAGIIAGTRPDAFLVFGWHSLSYVQAIRGCRRARVPALVRGDSQLATVRSRLRRAAKAVLYPVMIRRFAACISVGTRSEEYFRRYRARAVFRSPHFVDNEFFASRAGDEQRAAARQRWSIPSDAFVVLFAGKLIDMKRPLDAIAAIAKANRADVHILIAGSGPLQDEMRARATAAGISAHFAGFLNQSQLPAAYAAADVLMLPSTAKETWGLVVNEAMACGKGAIVSRSVGCTPDLIDEGVTGYSVAEGDIDGFANRISELAQSRGRARVIGDAAKHRISGFNVCAAADGVLAAAEYARARGRTG